MDPNLEKIRDSNMFLIRKGKISRAIRQGKDYLTNILGEYRIDEIDKELDKFVEDIKLRATAEKQKREQRQQARQ
jgi:hypothetical protein